MIKLFSKSKGVDAPLFEGTNEDFHKYFSGFCRNLVQKITRSYKLEIGCCENCGEASKQLDAAHTHGNERKDIIDNILAEYQRDGIVRISLNIFEHHFIEAHRPLGDIIKILCKNCHVEYDQKNTKLEKSNPATKQAKLKSFKPLTMTKQESIEFINNKLGKRKLTSNNTNYSNINKASGRFWLNIEPDRFKSDLNIILVDRAHIIWIYLPLNSLKDPTNTLNTRKDNGKIDLDIPTKGNHAFLIDRSGFDFRPFSTIYEREI